ncbi:MAG: N-acyl homoserine lactonase family protein [Pseudomonadota bacterium]
MTPTYEVFAIKYATHDRKASENFLFGDPHDGPMPIDYYVWAIKGAERSFVVDMGFDAPTAAARGRKLLRCPGEGLRLVGIDPATVEELIVTHLHYDHAGNFDLFPKARFHLQDREVAYATGRHMGHACLNHPFDVEHVVKTVRRVYAGQVAFHDGDAEIAPGLSVHRVGGHSDGLQFVRVWTARGWVVLASDASHFYANMEQNRPFVVAFHIGAMLDAFRKLYELADSPVHVVPGHDPLVMARYPAPRPDLEGIVVRLDVDPRA